MLSLELCVKLKMISYDVVFIAPKNLHNIAKQHVLPHCFSQPSNIFQSLPFCNSAAICPNVSRPQSRRLVVFTKFKIIIFIFGFLSKRWRIFFLTLYDIWASAWPKPKVAMIINSKPQKSTATRMQMDHGDTKVIFLKNHAAAAGVGKSRQNKGKAWKVEANQ